MTDVVTAAARTRGYELRLDGGLVARLFVMPSAGATLVRVAAELFPVTMPEGTDPQWRFHELPASVASRFVEETIQSFMYLGCSVKEIESEAAIPSAGARMQPVHAVAA